MTIVPRLYHYDDESGMYTRTSDARPNPRPDAELFDDEFLIPRNATKVRPHQDILDGVKQGYWIGDSWSAVAFPEPEEAEESREKLLATVLDLIDRATEYRIAYGFVYNGQPVRLTMYDQLNFEGEKNNYVELDQDGLFVEADHFPTSVKVWTAENGTPVKMAIDNLAMYKAFVRTGKAYIRSELDGGWTLKNTAATLTAEQLKTWEDPRG